VGWVHGIESVGVKNARGTGRKERTDQSKNKVVKTRRRRIKARIGAWICLGREFKGGDHHPSDYRL